MTTTTRYKNLHMLTPWSLSPGPKSANQKRGRVKTRPKAPTNRSHPTTLELTTVQAQSLRKMRLHACLGTTQVEPNVRYSQGRQAKHFKYLNLCNVPPPPSIRHLLKIDEVACHCLKNTHHIGHCLGPVETSGVVVLLDILLSGPPTAGPTAGQKLCMHWQTYSLYISETSELKLPASNAPSRFPKYFTFSPRMCHNISTRSWWIAISWVT